MFSRYFAKLRNIKVSDKMQQTLALSAIITVSVCAGLLIFSSYLAKERVTMPVVEEYRVFAEKVEKRNLKLGIVSGPYGDMFREAIEPTLLQKGYTLETVVYDNYTEPNFDLANGKIDLNMFQHYRYLNNFKLAYNLDLTAITEIPTAPMAIFSNKYNSFESLPEGAVAAIPSDITNRARALILLESAGIVLIDPYVDKVKTTKKDLIKNPKNIQILLLDPQDLVQSLSTHDLAVINGNFAISGGLKLSNALYREVLAENYINVIAVRTEDLDNQFVRDIIEVVHSPEYKKIVTDPNGKYDGFQLPRNLLDRDNQGGGT